MLRDKKTKAGNGGKRGRGRERHKEIKMESIITRIEMLNFRASIERSDVLIPRYGCMIYLFVRSHVYVLVSKLSVSTRTIKRCKSGKNIVKHAHCMLLRQSH